MESILTTVKKCLGIAEDYTAFDTDVIMHINAAFSTLHQLGNPEFSISDKSSLWTDYISNNDAVLNAAKQYVILKTRILFDPPSSSFVSENINKQIQELEWRINVAVD